MTSDDRPRGVIRLHGPQRGVQPPPTRTPHPGPRPESPRSTTLTRGAPTALITDAARGVLQANLNWNPGADADLDLGCLLAHTDGSALALQALGDSYGALDSWPYAALDRDDRTGSSSDGETLRVNWEHRARFRRLLFYVYVYEGAVDFRRLGARVTVTAPGADTFHIRLDDSPAGATACAIALATAEPGGFALRRETRWFTATPLLSNQQQIDRAYGFGLPWHPGSKPPRA